MEPTTDFDAPEAGDVEVGEEPITAQPEAGVEAPQEPTEVPTEPVEPEPEPEPDFRLPGQEEPGQRELDWYQKQYAEALNALQQYRTQLEEYELAGMDDDEKATYKAQQEYQQLQREVESLRMERATEQWRDYYRQFAPTEVDLTRERNPVNMQHQVLTSLHQQLQQLQKENAAYKRAMSGQPKANPVTTGGGGAPKPSSIWSLDQTKEQRDEIFYQAKQGLIQ
jgi:hypothetical protein